MSLAVPWYAKPWRRIRPGRRTLVASAGYLLTGLVALIVAVVSSRGAAVRLVWIAIAVAFLYMGATLVATFMWQRRMRSRS